MYCKNCGKVLSVEDKFCSNCGAKVIADRPAPTDSEPMFFVQKREEKESAKEKRPKRVIHLDEFNWNLDGYPTTPKKTEDIDFDWDSVIEEHVRKAAPKLPEEEVQSEPEPQREREPEPVDEHQEESQEKESVESLPEPSAAPLFNWKEKSEPEEVRPAEAAVVKEAPAESVSSLEEIFQSMDTTPIEEPTKLIDKSQMKAESVDRFYIFSKKQAEFQSLLDQEYEKIQNSLIEKQGQQEAAPEPETVPAEKPEKSIRAAIPEEAPKETVKELPEEELMTAETLEEKPAAIESATVEPEVQMVAVVWAKPPAGIVVEAEGTDAEEKTADVPAEEPEESTMISAPEAEEKPAEEQQAEEAKSGEVKPEEVSESNDGDTTSQEDASISFADIFDDEEDDEPEGKGGKFLKVLAIILCILVVIELTVLGIQRFAPNSKAAEVINDAYNKVIEIFTGSEGVQNPEEMEGPTEIQQIITHQMEKNENIVVVEENTRLLFEEGKDYGYSDFKDSFAFQNSAWYDTEDGSSITFADEIVGTLIQYYSALVDKKNGVNNDVIDFVDKNSAFFETVDAIKGTEDSSYGINYLEIGEIRTGEKGFYVITRITAVDKGNPNGAVEKHIVYLEPNTSKKEMKIKDIKTI